MNFYNKFLLLWVIFALLDPDSGSGSTDPIESGSNPDPQPWFPVTSISAWAVLVHCCLRFVYLCRFLNNLPVRTGYFTYWSFDLYKLLLFKCLKWHYFPERVSLLFFHFFIPLLSDLDLNPGTGFVLHSVSAKEKIYGSCSFGSGWRSTTLMIPNSIFNEFLVHLFERKM